MRCLNRNVTVKCQSHNNSKMKKEKQLPIEVERSKQKAKNKIEANGDQRKNEQRKLTVGRQIALAID